MAQLKVSALKARERILRGFCKLHAQLGMWRVVRGLLEGALVMTRLLKNHCSRSVDVVDPRS